MTVSVAKLESCNPGLVADTNSRLDGRKEIFLCVNLCINIGNKLLEYTHKNSIENHNI